MTNPADFYAGPAGTASKEQILKRARELADYITYTSDLGPKRTPPAGVPVEHWRTLE